MLLSQDKRCVEALNHILKNYDYLEYDEKRSHNKDRLYVKVIRPNADRDPLDAIKIRRALKQVLNRVFINVFVGCRSTSWSTKWTNYYIAECKSLSAYMNNSQ